MREGTRKEAAWLCHLCTCHLVNDTHKDFLGRGRAATAWVVWLLVAFLAKWKKLGERRTFTDPALTSTMAHAPRFSVINRSYRGQWLWAMLWRQKDLGSDLRPATSHLYAGSRSLPISDAVSSPWGLCEKSICEAPAEFLEPHRRPSMWPYVLVCSVLQACKHLVLHILYQVEHHLAGKQTPTQWVIIQCSNE